VDASYALVSDFEDDGEEGHEPEVAGELCQQGDRAYMSDVLVGLLICLLSWERSNQHKNRVATQENAQQRYVDH